MGVAAQIFSLPSLTLVATVESILAIKFFGDSFPRIITSEGHLGTAAVVFLVNYAFAALFWGFIYPRVFSPLRHIPGPRVS
jgi:hypothetical protein